jgi:ubiquinone/menaquinone biosynthesis C-methylase UbiE
MPLTIPAKGLLAKTGEVDYFDWNYKFPIKFVMRYRFKRIVQLLGKKNYPVLLEAGTGSGIFIPELAKHCDKIYACDIHNKFEKINLMCRQLGIKSYHLSTQSIDNTNYPNEHFDAIVATSVLEFVPDIPKALTEIKRILKKDGVFITICPMESRFLDFIISLYAAKKPKEEFGDARKSVSKLLEQNFIVEKKGYMIKIIGRLFPVYTHYKLKKP